MCSTRQLALLFLLCSLVGFDAIRLDDESDAEDRAVAVREDDGADDQAVLPFDFWNFANSSSRCADARRGRNVRRIFGAVVGIALAIPIGIITSLAYNMLYWTWYLDGAKNVIMWISAHAAAIAGLTTAIMATRLGTSLVHWKADMIAYLFGQDGHKPVCCCDEGEPMACGTLGSSHGKRADCPPGWTHRADQCESREPALTFDAKTAGGCECVESSACEKNQYHRGHAWCTVKTAKDCSATRFKSNPFKHWDYCEVASGAVVVDPDTAPLAVNTFVSQFTINRDRGFFRGDARHVWAFGSYVDESKALVTAPVTLHSGDKISACFPGEPEETLDGCAQKCIEDGAPISNELGKKDPDVVDCYAFAYNMHSRLCVRLPKAASGAEFKPYQRNPLMEGGHRTGWQNFRAASGDAFKFNRSAIEP